VHYLRSVPNKNRYLLVEDQCKFSSAGMGASSSRLSSEPKTPLCHGILCFANDDELAHGEGFLQCCSRIKPNRNSEQTQNERPIKRDMIELQSPQGKQGLLHALNDCRDSSEVPSNRFSDRTKAKFKSILPWKKQPDPLQNWTIEEQQVLESELKNNPQARKYPEQLEKLLEKSQRKLPNKSLAEIHLCFTHLNLSRIAYFGPDSERSTRRSKTPLKTQYSQPYRPRPW
jgi:hypothetical protein